MISKVLTLLPGDVISTGSRLGVAPMAHGDTVEIEVEGIGILRNPFATGPSQARRRLSGVSRDN